MRLEPPLSNLLGRRMTMCEAQCCAINAYDINLIHVASYLLRYRGTPDTREVERIREQLDSLKAKLRLCRCKRAWSDLRRHEPGLLGVEIDAFADSVMAALDGALSLLADPRFTGTRAQR